MKRSINKILVLTILAALTYIGTTNAVFHSSANIYSNSITTGFWETDDNPGDNELSCTVKILEPGGGEIYTAGNPKQNITWEMSGVNNPEKDTYIKLFLSTNGGITYTPSIGGNTKKINNSVYEWNPHPANNSDLKVKIAVYDRRNKEICNDVSNSSFEVTPESTVNTQNETTNSELLDLDIQDETIMDGVESGHIDENEVSS
jgi:hypothetical protein